MNVSLYEAGINDKLVIDNLMQLYLHDLSKYSSIEIGSKGRYEQGNTTRYFSSFDCKAYIIHAEYRIIGFLFTEPEDNHLLLKDLFILNMWRRKNIAKRVVDQLLKGGTKLVVRFNKDNEVAMSFANGLIDNPLYNASKEDKGVNVEVKILPS